MDPVIAPDGKALLPFAFARRFGVVIIEEVGPRDQAVVAYRTSPSLTTLAEIKRYAKRPIAPRLVTDEEFEALLTATYARDSSEAKQMVEDMGDELDLARGTNRGAGVERNTGEKGAQGIHDNLTWADNLVTRNCQTFAKVFQDN